MNTLILLTSMTQRPEVGLGFLSCAISSHLSTCWLRSSCSTSSLYRYLGQLANRQPLRRPHTLFSPQELAPFQNVRPNGIMRPVFSNNFGLRRYILQLLVFSEPPATILPLSLYQNLSATRSLYSFFKVSGQASTD